MSEAPMTPGSTASGEGSGACKKPRQFQAYWWEFMAPLPSQILRPVREALSIHRKRPARLRSIDAARYALRDYKASAEVTADSVEAMMRARGMEHADPNDPDEAAAFLDRIGDSGRKALAKTDRVGIAIFYAELTLDWLDSELSRGQR